MTACFDAWWLEHLIEHGGGVVRGQLALPTGDQVASDAIEEFLESDTTPSLTTRPPLTSKPWRELPKGDSPQWERFLDCQKTLSSLAVYSRPHQPVDSIAFRTISVTHHVAEIYDPATDQRVGTLYRDFLDVEDERDRERLLQFLDDRDVNIPLWARPACISELTPPNVHSYWRTNRDTGDLVAVLLTTEDHQPGPYWWHSNLDGRFFAVYEHEKQALHVIDDSLGDAATAQLARIGIKPRDVLVPATETPISEPPFPKWRYLAFPNELVPRPQDGISHVPSLRLRAELASQVPDSFSALPIEWYPGIRGRTDEYPGGTPFLMRHVEAPMMQLPTILGDGASFTGRVTLCRLCDAVTREVTTELCREPLAYCGICLAAVRIGLPAANQDEGKIAATDALRVLIDTEFEGIPPLAEQLSYLYVDPDEPWSAAQIDRALLLRLAIRRDHPWNQLVLDSQGHDATVKLGRGTLSRARDGHLCHSTLERTICDFLHQYEIRHEREPTYGYDAELNPRRSRRADWLLADGTFVEMWGLPDQDAYAQKMSEKRELANRLGIALLELTAADLKILPYRFKQWLPAGIDATTRWRWSPPDSGVAVHTGEQAKQGTDTSRRHVDRAKVQVVSPAPASDSIAQRPQPYPRRIRAQEIAAGVIGDYHFVETVDPIKQLKREGRNLEALQLCYQAIEAAERDSGYVGSPPWYSEQAAIIHRRLGESEQEIAVLKRWLKGAHLESTALMRFEDRLRKLEARQ